MEDMSAVQTLYKIVEDPDLCNAYEEFLVGCFAWENFGFWFEVEMFKKEDDPKELKRKAKLIFAKFLDIGSIFELGDLDPATRQAIQQRLRKPTKVLFNALQRRVMNSLALSTISDFLNAEIYLLFKASREGGVPKPVKNRKSLTEQARKLMSAKPKFLNMQDAKLIRKDTPAKGFLFNFHTEST